jgi:hypothetical protein
MFTAFTVFTVFTREHEQYVHVGHGLDPLAHFAEFLIAILEKGFCIEA